MVTFGNASGAVEPFSPGLLAAKGSLFLTRPTLATYTRTREQLEAVTADLFDVVTSGGREGRGGADLSPQGCRSGAPGSGGAEDDRFDSAGRRVATTATMIARADRR